jgi:hypothetical protein
MSLAADDLYKLSDVELLTTYLDARRQFVEKKFTRDTHRRSRSSSAKADDPVFREA